MSKKKNQAKAGEVLTHEDVLQRLKNDKEDQKAPKGVNKQKLSDKNINENIAQTASELKSRPPAGAWII